MGTALVVIGSRCGLDALDQFGDLVVDLLTFLHHPLHLVDRVDDGGVVASTELACDRRMGEVGEVADDVSIGCGSAGVTTPRS